MYTEELIQTARLLVTSGKGILAADESTGTIGKRFKSIEVENTEENRRKYRKLLFSTKGLEEYISGVILFEETFNQTDENGILLIQLLEEKGIIPGIKVDKGIKPLPGTNGEFLSQGLDDLDVRCAQYYAKGARFAKWRAVFHIKDNFGATPSQLAIEQNVQALAIYACICQSCGLVPIVEPEVLMDGDFTIDVAEAATEKVLASVFNALLRYHVLLEGMLLKPNMIRSGSDFPQQALSAEIGRATMRVLQHTVPCAVPGVTFLSGGMTEDEASLALSAINNAPEPHPWRLSFSFGRALQQSCLKEWKGEDSNISTAQNELIFRAKASSLAALGKYSVGESEKS